MPGCGCLIVVVAAFLVALLLLGSCHDNSDDSLHDWSRLKCQAVRVIALDNGNPRQQDAAVDYSIHC